VYGARLTILPAGGHDRELLRWATTRVVLSAEVESGALHSDLLA
jgi:hypothetical protein